MGKPSRVRLNRTEENSRTMAATFKIDQLTGENYDTWKIHMRAILKKNDLWGYVSGEIPKPEVSTPDYAKWIKMDGKAESDILLAVSASELTALDGLETSRQIWDKLKSMYQSSGPARKATLLKKLALTRMQEEDDIKKHLTEFFEADKKLREIGLLVPNELLAILLLYSLPESFEMFRTAMESRDDLPPTDILKVKILEEHESRKSRDSGSGQGAMYVKKKHVYQRAKENEKIGKYQDKEEPRYRNKIECYRCHRFGHIANECRSFVPKYKQSARQLEDKDCERGRAPRNQDRTSMLTTTEEVMYGNQAKSEWCIDSGCTGHMCSERSILQDFTRINSELNLANNESTRITGMGRVNLLVDNGNEEREIDIEKVFYVSDLRTNLLSVSRMTDHELEVRFRKEDAIVINKNNKVVMRANRIGNLYYVNKCNNSANNIEVQQESAINEWHKRLGHVNERDLKTMVKNGLVHGLQLKDNEKLSECEICVREKQTSKPFPKGSEERTSEPLEIVHTDVCGPMRHASWSNKKYFVTFIDDYSRWCEVYFIRNKSDVLTVFKEYKAEMENFTGKRIKALQSDNGREYVNSEFDTYLKKCGIKRRLTVPYTPQQNGVAERKNRTLVEMARCMMRQAGVPPIFWAEAVNTACYIRNRCPTAALKGRLPFTVWTGKTPTMIYMQTFGTKVFVKIKGNRGKFDSRSEEGIFVGYDRQSKAYRVHLPRSKQTIASRDVKFMGESAFRHEYKEILDADDSPCDEIEVESSKPEEDNEDEEQRQIDVVRRGRKRGSTVSWEELVQPMKRGRGRPRLIRSGSRGRPRKQYASTTVETGEEEDSDEENDEEEEPAVTEDEVFTANIATHDPLTWQEALETEDSNAWKIAMEDEYLAQIKNCTWEIVPRPKRRKVIGSRFVFTTKSTGDKMKKKVRLVAKGCSQRPGEDFHNTFSPVVRPTSIRLLSAIAAEFGLEIHQMDVVTAYLNGDLEEDVYMEEPEQLREVLRKLNSSEKVGSSDRLRSDKVVRETAERWYEKLKTKNDNVCLLKKSLYGLRQSGLQWHKKFVECLNGLGMRALTQDPCMFVSHKNDQIMLIAIYVDDMIIASNDGVWMSKIKRELSEAFEMKDLGRIRMCLGIEFLRDKDKRVYLNQKRYTEEILERFGMSECKAASTPIESNCKLTKPEYVNKEVMGQYPYQNLIGALMYLAVSTRPDIAFAVNYLSQFNTNYNAEHWKAAKRVLRYLRGTSECGLMYERTELSLFGVVDADWGSNVVDRRSYSGYAYILAGAPISWEARKQKTVALSSTEAEYMAISEATKEAVYLREILNDVGMSNECVTIFNDNQGAIKLAENNRYHSRTKHIDIRHHFLRSICQQGIIELKYMASEKMPADVLTKGLSGVKHRECLFNLGVVNMDEC